MHIKCLSQYLVHRKRSRTVSDYRCYYCYYVPVFPGAWCRRIIHRWSVGPERKSRGSSGQCTGGQRHSPFWLLVLGLYVMPEITEAIPAMGQSNFGYFVTWDNKLSYCLSLLPRTVKNILTGVPSKGTQGLVKATVRLNHVWN